MALSSSYIPASTFSEPQLDKDTGLPMAAGVVSFYRDSQRRTPKNVWKLTGQHGAYDFVEIGSVLTFGLNGTFTDQNGDQYIPYFYPFDNTNNPPSEDLYYVTIVNADGTPQYTLEAIPYIPPGVIGPDSTVDTSNELLNPQFIEVSFNPAEAHVYTVSSGTNTTEIAPNWFITTAAAGDFTVSRLEVVDTPVPTNPPYAIGINAGVGLGSTVTLTQRLFNSPRLLHGQTVSGSLIAATSGSAAQITMKYVPSDVAAASYTFFQDTVTPNGVFQPLGNVANIIGTASTEGADTGYVDIQIIIPTGQLVYLSSIQVVGTGSGAVVDFDQQSTQIQTNGLFQYYYDSILTQPKQTILAGWQFGLNPWQFRTTSSTNVANNTYTADQTILIQSAYVASTTPDNVAVSRGNFATNYAYTVTAVTTTNRFAIVQYIDPATIRPYWGYNLSSLVKAKLNTVNATTCRFKMRLLYRTSLPSTIGQNEPFLTWAVDAEPTYSSGWTAIVPEGDPIYTLTSTVTSFPFNKMTLPASTNDAMTLAVVIYTLDNLSITGTDDSVEFRDVSLVPNDFAMSSYVLTWDEELKRCQYYYESSYAPGVLPGAITDTGAYSFPQTTSVNAVDTNPTFQLTTASFTLPFETPKRTNTPLIHFYSPVSGTIDLIRWRIYYAGALQSQADIASTPTWTQILSNRNVVMQTIGTNLYPTVAPNANVNITGYAYAHFTAGARLGIASET